MSWYGCTCSCLTTVYLIRGWPPPGPQGNSDDWRRLENEIQSSVDTFLICFSLCLFGLFVISENANLKIKSVFRETWQTVPTRSHPTASNSDALSVLWRLILTLKVPFGVTSWSHGSDGGAPVGPVVMTTIVNNQLQGGTSLFDGIHTRGQPD